MASRYSFADYSPAWPAAFEAARERLAPLFGEELVALHHIGSTAVPGLAAKPTIDLLPVVRDIARVDTLGERLERAGYRVWGERGLPGRRLFTLDDAAGRREQNAHVYAAGHPDVERHLAFRDHLRADAAARDEYAALKREAYARHPADIAAYNDHKTAWIRRVERIALNRRGAGEA